MPTNATEMETETILEKSVVVVVGFAFFIIGALSSTTTLLLFLKHYNIGVKSAKIGSSADIKDDSSADKTTKSHTAGISTPSGSNLHQKKDAMKKNLSHFYSSATEITA